MFVRVVHCAIGVGLALAMAASCAPPVPRLQIVSRSLITGAESMSFVEPTVVLSGGVLTAAAIRFVPDESSSSGFFSVPGTFECRVFESADGGSTWRPQAIPPLRFCGDPWLTTTGDGLAFAAVVTVVETGALDLGVLRKRRGGEWRLAHIVNGTWDRPTVTAIRGDTLLVTAAGMRGPAWTFVMDADDREVARVALGPEAENQSGNPAVQLSDGSLLAVFTDYERQFVRRSADGGRSWGDAALVSSICSDPFQQVAEAGSRLVFACEADDAIALFVSDDKGASWRPISAPAVSGNVGTVGLVAVRPNEAAVVWQSRTADGCRSLHFAPIGTEGAAQAEVISAEPTCPPAGADAYLQKRYPHAGDYIGVTAGRLGAQDVLAVVWPVFQPGGALALESVILRPR